LFEANEGGVSNYGLYAKTFVPYTLGFCLSGALTLLASRFITYKPLKLSLILIGVLLLVVLCSTYPYKVSQTLDDVHQTLGTILVVVELVMATWFSFFLARNRINIIILTIQSIGFILALLTHFSLIHVLFVAELLTTLSFGLLLIRTVADVEKDHQPMIRVKKRYSPNR
jgi:hypothetical protein